jgi:hypothetical protein
MVRWEPLSFVTRRAQVNVEDLPSSEEEGDENLEVALKLIKQRKNYKHAYGNQVSFSTVHNGP